jgi:DNA modification methylase
MRKPGENPEPVTHKPSGFNRWIGPEGREPKVEKKADPGKNKYSHEVWQRYASPVWFDINPSDTLQKASAREQDDSRHICPLQLTVIRRAIELWSNPGDTVLSPFAGIGSEGYVALEEGRRFVGMELKESYYRQACRNLETASKIQKQGPLFE